MDMSRVSVRIGRIVLKGLEAFDQKALAQGLQGELSVVLSDPGIRARCSRSFTKPVVKIGRMPLEPGSVGGMKFGSALGRTIGQRLTS
jgi:hypothetical protein